MELPNILLTAGNTYEVSVINVIQKGCIVSLSINDENYTEFIHISKISKDYVNNINDYVAVGDTFTAKCIDYKGKKELVIQATNKNASSTPDENTYSKGFKSNKTMDLNAMIAKAESVMKDKIRSQETRNGKRRNSNRRRNNRDD